jgi:uncharacterized protein YqgQ
MIYYVAGFYISFMSVLEIIVYSQGKKDKKARIIYERSRVLKSKRLQKRYERWAEADRILESIEIESE